MASTIDVEFANINEVMARLDNDKEAAGKAMYYTCADVYRRAPSWVSQEVSKVCGIKKSEVKPRTKSITKSGDGAEGMLKYVGTYLTPTHYHQTPKAPGHNSYKIRMTVKKGNRVQFGQYRVRPHIPGGPYSAYSGNILMPLGGQYLAAHRVGRSKYPIEVFRTVSMPQTISGVETKPKIEERLAKEAQKRLEHNIQRLQK